MRVAPLLLLAACAASPERSGDADVLVARVYVEADYDAVWRSFTEADEYADWYSSPCLEFGAVGEPASWGTAERTVYHGEVLRLAPGEGLTHTFQFVGFGFEEPPTPVEVAILERGPVVLIEVRHDCAGAPRTRDIIGAVGWQKSLSRLKTLLETGRAMPWPDE